MPSAANGRRLSAPKRRLRLRDDDRGKRFLCFGDDPLQPIGLPINSPAGEVQDPKNRELADDRGGFGQRECCAREVLRAGSVADGRLCVLLPVPSEDALQVPRYLPRSPDWREDRGYEEGNGADGCFPGQAVARRDYFVGR